MIKVIRHTPCGRMTFGTWYMPDGTALCWTCEDEVRAPGIVVPKMTAIPAGVATIELSMSPKFGRPLPHIYSHAIPPERGIRVHRGENDTNTDGCVLVGFTANIPHGLKRTEQAESAIVRYMDQLPGKRTMIQILEVLS